MPSKQTVQKALSVHALGALSSLFLGIFLFVGFLYFPKEQPAPAAAVTAFPPTLHIEDSSILAKSAVIYDPATGKILYGKNADVTMPLASITKLMTAQVALSNIPTS